VPPVQEKLHALNLSKVRLTSTIDRITYDADLLNREPLNEREKHYKQNLVATKQREEQMKALHNENASLKKEIDRCKKVIETYEQANIKRKIMIKNALHESATMSKTDDTNSKIPKSNGRK
jgi:predicted RNase H-like nuclease (RuvC/YqgF family)